MNRKLFCQISPVTYRISVWKCRAIRHLKNKLQGENIAKEKIQQPLPNLIYRHKSLIRRTLGNTQMQLQENKAVNLAIAVKEVNGILIRPGETFSFWELVGEPNSAKGYREGVTVSGGQSGSGIGGGLCQFTNLIHWMILHTDLEITEHHHHDQFDLFPDFQRQIPFGTGTSILYNYLDYRFRNNSKRTFQLLVWTDETHLCGELRATEPLTVKYHIEIEDEYFSRENGEVYRNGKVFRRCIDKRSGAIIFRQLLRENHAKVLYDSSNLNIREEKKLP